MAIKKSAKKAIRQNIKRRKINLFYQNKIKNLVKEIRDLAVKKNPPGIQKKVSEVYKALDKAAKVGTIKKNAATRRKARIAKLVKKLK